MKSQPPILKQTKPILLYDGECGVCRSVAHWVEKSARSKSGAISLVLIPNGDDPEALKLINPNLNIWDVYATNYLVMPDGSMKTGGEAVAEVFRILPNTKWFAGCFAFSIYGYRPFQMMLNLGYAILDDVRPVFGCESCGTPSLWVRPFAATAKWLSSTFGPKGGPEVAPKFTSRKVNPRQSSTKPNIIPK